MAKTILLADDSVTIQKVVELTFMDQDYQVVATGDGDSALEQLSEVGPDLVIADVHMPGADGYEVCRRTKEAHPGIPVLLLVGTFEQFDEAKAVTVGADGHLKKPFDSQDLLSQVEHLITRYSAAQPAAVPAVESDAFALDTPLPVVGDLEPPSLEASAPPAGDVWGAEFPVPVPEVETAPTLEPEPSVFTTAPALGFGAPTADLDADVTETAAVDLADLGSIRPTELEAPTFDLEESTDDLPEVAPMPTAPIEYFEPEPLEPEPLEAEPLEAPTLEVPSLEAPTVESFSPFDDPPAVEEAVTDPWATATELEAPAASAPEVAAVADDPIVSEPVAEEPFAVAPVAETLVVEDPFAEEPAVAAPVVEEPIAVAPMAAAPVVEEPAVAAPVVEAPAVAAATNGSGALSDDDVDRIARRVAELVGEKTLRDVAWDVLPDLAEVIIKERIRELESQVE